MYRRFINPPGSPTPKNYHHVVVIQGGRTIYLSGQVAFDAERNIVGGNDLVEQTRQALRNVKTAVEAGGGQLSDVIKLSPSVVNYKPEQLEAVTDAIGEFFATDSLPANTLLGVDSLSTVGLLVEIEALAVTDAPVP